MLLTFFLLIAGLVINSLANAGIRIIDVSVLTFCFLIISIIAIYIFHRGQKKEPDNQTMHILVAISVKLLLELILVLVWFIVAKKKGTASLLLFFVLYLAFSIFSIYLMLNTLKHKSL